jgi:alpha-1,2-mannosyltransferase
MNASPFRPSAPSSGRVWFLLGLIVLFGALSVQYSIKALHNRSAFDRWKGMVVSGVENGDDIAAKYAYPNPPIMAVVLYPFAKLPSVWGALTWFYVKVGLTLLAFHWVFQLVETPDRPFPLWARVVTVLLSLRPIIGDLHHGNVNLFILFLVVAGLAAFRYRRDLLCGLLIGLAVACKVTPALFIPYFLWKRQWRVLAGCAAGLILFLWPGFVPALFLGWNENQQQVRSWYMEMVYPFVVEGKVTSDHPNQSAPGLIARLATHSASFSTYVKDANGNDIYTPTEYDNLLNLSQSQARWLVKGFMALFALVVVWRCRTPTTPRDNWRLGAEFSLILLGMLMFSERTWKHHCVTLVLPFAVLCYCLATQPMGRWLRWGLIGSLAVVALLMASTSSGIFADDSAKAGDVADLFAKQAQVYGAYVWAYFVLAADLVVVLRRPGGAPDDGNSVKKSVKSAFQSKKGSGVVFA